MNLASLETMWVTQDPVARTQVLAEVRKMTVVQAFQLARAIGDRYGQNAWRVKVQEFMTAVQSTFDADVVLDVAKPVADTAGSVDAATDAGSGASVAHPSEVEPVSRINAGDSAADATIVSVNNDRIDDPVVTAPNS